MSDQGYNGCVITLGRDFSRISSDAGDGIVTAGAGVVLARLVGEVLKRSLAGLECCVGIPGCVGGAVSMNAGTAHGMDRERSERCGNAASRSWSGTLRCI